MQQRHKGFTLVEMMTAMAVTASLTMAALPTFTHAINRQALAHTANDLTLAVFLGRSEAMARGNRVVLAPLQPSDWSRGWYLFVDRNDNGLEDAGEEKLRVFEPGGVSLQTRAWGAPANNVLSFTDDGFLRRPGGNGLAMGGISFSVGDQVRTVCFSATRTRVTTATSCGS